MDWKEKTTNFKSNFPILMSLCGVACLNVFSVKTMLAACMFVLTAAVLSFFWKRPQRKPTRITAVGLTCLWTCLVLVLSVRFNHRMQDNIMVIISAGFLDVSSRDLSFDIAFCGAILALTAPVYAWIPKKDDQYVPDGRERLSHRVLLTAFLTALTVIGICSKSSPIYPFNDWVDANCYMTVGKSMLHGLVPYRDLYEHKGPLLYALHAVASLISDTTFLGVFFFEVFAATVFLVISYRTVSLFRQEMSPLWLLAVAAVIYSANSFCHGDSAEEFCLPLFAYGIYCGMQAIREKRLPNGKESFLIGITSACVLWIKFSLLGFYIGWFAAFLLLALKRRAFFTLVKRLGQIILGVILISIPVIGYFALNGALTDLFGVYFYNNLFVYASVPAENPLFMLIMNVLTGFRYMLHYNLISITLLIIAILYQIKSCRFTEAMFAFFCWIVQMVLIYAGGRKYYYYALVSAAFVPLVIPAFWDIQRSAACIFGRKKWIGKAAVVAASLLFAFFMCENTYLLQFKKSDMPQYQFATIINQKEDATLLDYGLLDGGFYTVADIVPNCKYFCSVNIPLEEMHNERQRYVEEGLVDFVVTKYGPLNADNYELVAESSFRFEDLYLDYRLYQRKE